MSTSNGKRIVVTGATGLIGRHLIRRLAARGDYPIALVRDVARGRAEVPEAREHIGWTSSMTDGPWTAAIDGADAVVNLAGAPVASRWTEERKKVLRSSRVDGTRHLVDAILAAKHPPSTLIQGSAVGYYGAWPSGRLDERSPAGTDFLAKLCVAWEAEAVRAGTHGVRVLLVRTGLVLDPEEGALGQLLLPFRLFVGGPIGSGRQPFPWIHMDDEIGILLWGLDSQEASGPVNGVAPGIVTNKEFSTALGRRLGRPSLVPVPPFVLRLMFGEGSSAMLGGQWAEPDRARELGYRFRYPGLTEALAATSV